MKIATWNLERLDKRKNSEVIEILNNLEADLIILTETNSIINLNNYDCFPTTALPKNFDGITYRDGENRVTIFTKYPFVKKYETYDLFTAVCCDFKTPQGILTVYGSIIGVFGNRQPRFDYDLAGQLRDFNKIFPGKNVCFAGDLNVTFSGRIYPSRKARETLSEAFKNLDLVNTTENIENNVDHLILSKTILEHKKFKIKTWNVDKKLSDHIGHLLTLE